MSDIPEPILFVDRDGTLIEEVSDEQVDRLDKVRLMPDVFAALQTLTAAGYRLVMVTNQDGIGSERFPRAHFELVHEFVLHLFNSQGISFDAVFICPHFAHEGCGCRKPRTGLVQDYLRQHTMDPARSAMIGDRETDLEFARALGIRGLRVGGAAPGQSWPAIARALLARTATVERTTRETTIKARVELDSDAPSRIASGIGFFDHMLEQLAKHGGFALSATNAASAATASCWPWMRARRRWRSICRAALISPSRAVSAASRSARCPVNWCRTSSARSATASARRCT